MGGWSLHMFDIYTSKDKGNWVGWHFCHFGFAHLILEEWFTDLYLQVALVELLCLKISLYRPSYVQIQSTGHVEGKIYWSAPKVQFRRKSILPLKRKMDKQTDRDIGISRDICSKIDRWPANRLHITLS